MQNHESIQPHAFVDLFEGLPNASRGPQVVAGSKGMAGVKTHGQAWVTAACADDIAQFREASSQHVALSSSVFQGNADGGEGGLLQHSQECFTQTFNAALFGLITRGAGMHDEAFTAKGMGTTHFVLQRPFGLVSEFGVRGGKIDQIAGVGTEELKRAFRVAVSEGGRCFLGQWRGLPASLVAHEDLQRGRLDLCSTVDG